MSTVRGQLFQVDRKNDIYYNKVSFQAEKVPLPGQGKNAFWPFRPEEKNDEISEI